MNDVIKRTLVALTIPAALALGACSGGAADVAEPVASASPSATATPTPTSTPTPTATPTVAGYETADALKDAAMAAGLPCEDWAPIEPDEYDDWTTAGECAYGKEHSTLYVFATADEAAESVDMLTSDSTWKSPIVHADNWYVFPAETLSAAQIKTATSGLGAKLFEQDPRDAKLYAEIAKDAKHNKRLATWEKNMKHKPGGSVLESY